MTSIKKIQSFILLICIQFTPLLVYAEQFTPNAGESNQYHWDKVMGSGHYERVSFLTRGVVVAIFFAFISWVLIGLWQAYAHGNLKSSEAIMYIFRILLLIIMCISLFTM